jgi:hypothetical protein
MSDFKSERLGHGNPAFTIDTYQHVLPGMQAEAARTFEQLIKEQQSETAGRIDGRRASGDGRSPGQQSTDRGFR